MISKKLIDFHIKNDYYIRVNRLKDGRGCKVTFPKNIIMGFPNKVELVYLLGNEFIEVYQLGDKEPIVDVKLPNYAKRLIVLADLKNRCDELNVNIGLCVFYDEEDERMEDDITVLDILPKCKEDSDREKALASIFCDIALQEDCSGYAKKHDIEDGYFLLYDILTQNYS